MLSTFLQLDQLKFTVYLKCIFAIQPKNILWILIDLIFDTLIVFRSGLFLQLLDAQFNVS